MARVGEPTSAAKRSSASTWLSIAEAMSQPVTERVVPP